MLGGMRLTSPKKGVKQRLFTTRRAFDVMRSTL